MRPSNVSVFRESVANTVKELTLHESKWNVEGWQKTWSWIDQEVLNDAFDQHGLVSCIFYDIGKISQRHCKSIARVEKKMTEQVPGRENFFKVVSDFVAVRVCCNVNAIPGKIDHIREIVLAQNGQVHVRGSSAERPYGFCMAPDKKYADITQYVYVFLEEVGYPIEFQIGHEFASHTFTIDSALRDNKDCGKVDLWSKDFYSDVKKFILNRANDEDPGSKEEIQAKAEAIHQGNVPEDIQRILNQIYGKKLNNVDAITSSSYGFRVFDWNNNRGNRDGAGKTLLGKVNLREEGWEHTIAFYDIPFEITQRDLEGMTEQTVADLFNRIIRRFDNIEIVGKKYSPTSIHLSVESDMDIPNRPFLFILGNEVQQAAL